MSYEYNDKPVPEGTNPKLNREWLREKLKDEGLAQSIEHEANIRYLSHYAPAHEVKRAFEEMMREENFDA